MSSTAGAARSSSFSQVWGTLEESRNRKDYGINFNAALETGTLLVGEVVALEINAEAIQETAAETGTK